MHTASAPRTASSTSAGSPRHVAVIGGGIAGLSAAWYLQTRGSNTTYTVLESADRWGGKVQTEHVDGPGETPFVVDAGPDSVLTRKPWALELARELDLGDQLVGTTPRKHATLVLHRGRLVPLPAGLDLLAPTRMLPFVRSPLFSMAGKLRMLLDLVIPARRDSADETLGDFITRRLGKEALDRLGEPLLCGIFNTEPERQSILATFPTFRQLEARHGGLIRGFRAARRRATTANLPPFMSLRGGMGDLVATLTGRLTGDLRLGVGVTGIRPDATGTFSMTLSDGSALAAHAVILATPASATAALVEEIAPAAARHLREIRTTGSGTISLAYPNAAVPHSLNGYGVVIPRSEARAIDAISWTSSKWPGRAPADHALLRVFFGGPKTPTTLDLSDDRLLQTVRRELADLLGITTAPIFHRLQRWPRSFPQYDLGHLDRVAAIESSLPTHVHVTGSSYRGVGIPDCVHQAEETVGRVLKEVHVAATS